MLASFGANSRPNVVNLVRPQEAHSTGHIDFVETIPRISAIYLQILPLKMTYLFDFINIKA